jgi:hypothetical protein
MPFDPTIPADGAFATGAALRGQFNGLKALIDAVPAGPPGPPGPVISTISVGSVTTGTPGSPAGAQVNVNGNNVELLFTIPAGDTGAPGEVSNGTLAGEISGTARNPNSVAPIPFTVSNPPTQAELQAVVDKLNELIGSLQR